MFALQEMVPILLVDDDDDCRLVMRDAIQNAKVKNDVFEVASGEDALNFIHKVPPYHDAPRPGLVYLDIELPGMNGIEVLRILKENVETRDIPVVMMTALDDDWEKAAAAQHGANSYCLKPSNPITFIETVIKATDYWLTIHKSPVAQLAE